MKLYELVNILQNFCHEGHAMREVVISHDCNDTPLHKCDVYEEGAAVVIEVSNMDEED